MAMREFHGRQIFIEDERNIMADYDLFSVAEVYLARRERDCCNSVFSQLIYCFVMRSKLTEPMQSNRARNRKRVFCIVFLVSPASQPGLKS